MLNYWLIGEKLGLFFLGAPGTVKKKKKDWLRRKYMNLPNFSERKI